MYKKHLEWNTSPSSLQYKIALLHLGYYQCLRNKSPKYPKMSKKL